jgi:hypothetical protein
MPSIPLRECLRTGPWLGPINPADGSAPERDVLPSVSLTLGKVEKGDEDPSSAASARSELIRRPGREPTHRCMLQKEFHATRPSDPLGRVHMQSRFFRLVDRRVFEAAPLDIRSLRDVNLEAFSAVRMDTKGQTGVISAPALMSVKELVSRDEAIFLLHAAAEVEHSLMVQYLFAAASLELRQESVAGTAVPADAASLHFDWFRTFMSIAKHEMAHLLTIQNILRALGGPLNFEREDFPFRTSLYPYPFELRPLTKTSLARYVAAEMPETPPAGTEADVAEIMERLADGNTVTTRVGTLYEKLITTVSSLDPTLFDAELGPWQGTVDEWAGSASQVIIREIACRDDAVKALQDIADQGEGAENAAGSHFELFLAIYRQFPDDRTDANGELAWRPAKPLLHNPNTTFEPPHDLAAHEEDLERQLDASRITSRLTRYWAHLFNVRYRILLTTIAHSLMRERGDSSPRTEMIRWCFEEMTVIARLMQFLADAPAREGVPASLISAGAPFELPYTMALPDRERDRWRLHRDLLDASAQIATTLRNDPEFEDPKFIVEDLLALDDARRSVVDSETGLARPCDGRGGIPA